MKRVAALAVIGVIGFLLALWRFGDAAAAHCQGTGQRDTTYSVEAGRLRMEQIAHVLTVTRDGAPLTGARVCFNAEMKGMPAMAVSDEGREVAPGRYEVSVTLGMRGDWTSVVLVEHDGRPRVAVPLDFRVG